MLKPTHETTSWMMALSATLVLCFSVDLALAQSQKYPFKQFPLPTDLPNIERMYEDHAGYIWLGTAEGLYRFDGINYLLYTSKDPHHGLGREVINCMYEDWDQHFWVGSRTGLYRYNPVISDFDKFSFAGDMYPKYMHQESDSSFLVLCLQGIFRFYPQSNRWDAINAGLEKASDYVMICGTHDDLWIGTEGKVRRYDLKTGTYFDYPLPVPGYSKPGEKIQVSLMFMDSRGLLWINTWYKGLVSIDTHSGKKMLFDTIGTAQGAGLMEIFISSFAEDNEGNIWLANTNSGVNIYHPQTGTFSRIHEGEDFSYGLRGRDFILLSDRQKNIWVKSDLALHYLSRSTLSPSLLSDPKTFIHDALCMRYISEQYMLVGTYYGMFGVNLVNHQVKPLNTLLKLPDTYNAEFQSTPDALPIGNIVWVSSPQGLRRMAYTKRLNDDISISFQNLYPCAKPFFPTKLFLLNDSLLFVKNRINTTSFATFNTVKSQYTYYTLPDTMVINYAIPFSGDSVLIAIRNKGLYYYTIHDQALHAIPWKFEQQEIAMINPVFFKIVALHDGRFALCSENYGLIIFDPRSLSFIHIDVAPLANTNRVYSVEEDSVYHLWIQASNQLLYYKPNEGSLLKINMSNTFGGNMPYFFMKDGTQLNATYAGRLYRMDPGQLFFKTQKPGLYLESIKSRDHELNWYQANEIRLDYEDNFLTYDFTGLDYDNPTGITYWYKIEEINEEWQFLGSRPSVSFGNLAPGRYHFVVKASNDAGIWSNEVRAPQVIIRPPFWQRWWFVGGIVAIIASIAIYLIRIRRMKREAELRLRNQIAKDLHDDIGSTLSGIKIFSVIASGMSAENNELSSLLQQIRDKSDMMMQSMSDIVWSINPAHDSLHDMMIRLKQYMAEVLESQDIEVHYSAPQDIRAIKIELSHRKELYLALKEIINNAAKYSAANHFYFEITRHKADILIIIRDDGKGMEEGALHSGNGLKNIESRISQVGAQMSRQSAPGQGVTYEIRIPVN